MIHNSPLVDIDKSSRKLSVFAWLKFPLSRSSAKNAMHAHRVIFQSILLMSGSSSAQVHLALGSKRCRFSYFSVGWKFFAISGSSKTDGCVAIWSKSLCPCLRNSVVIGRTGGLLFWSSACVTGVRIPPWRSSSEEGSTLLARFTRWWACPFVSFMLLPDNYSVESNLNLKNLNRETHSIYKAPPPHHSIDAGPS